MPISNPYLLRSLTNRGWVEFGLRKGDCFVEKVVIFPSFSSVIMNFFSPIGLVSFIDPLHQKLAKA